MVKARSLLAQQVAAPPVGIQSFEMAPRPEMAPGRHGKKRDASPGWELEWWDLRG